LPDERLEPVARVADDQLKTSQAAAGQGAEDVGPERLGFRGHNGKGKPMSDEDCGVASRFSRRG